MIDNIIFHPTLIENVNDDLSPSVPGVSNKLYLYFIYNLNLSSCFCHQPILGQSLLDEEFLLPKTGSESWLLM